MGKVTLEEFLKNKTDGWLKEEALGLHCAIYKADCFSISDLQMYEAILDELEKRGYEVEERTELLITGDEEEEIEELYISEERSEA